MVRTYKYIVSFTHASTSIQFLDKTTTKENFVRVYTVRDLLNNIERRYSELEIIVKNQRKMEKAKTKKQ